MKKKIFIPVTAAVFVLASVLVLVACKKGKDSTADITSSDTQDSYESSSQEDRDETTTYAPFVPTNDPDELVSFIEEYHPEGGDREFDSLPDETRLVWMQGGTTSYTEPETTEAPTTEKAGYETEPSDATEETTKEYVTDNTTDGITETTTNRPAVTEPATTKGNTQNPTTQAPTTQTPTTQAPTEPATTKGNTQAPTTQAPTTQAPTEPEATVAPTEPETEEPTTAAFPVWGVDDPFTRAGYTVTKVISNKSDDYDVRYTNGVWNIRYYNLPSETLTITKYLGSDTEVVIPATIAGYTVNYLKNTFMDHTTHFTKVTIPAGVTDMDSTFSRAVVDMIVFEPGSQLKTVLYGTFPSYIWLIENGKVNVTCESRVRDVIVNTNNLGLNISDFEFTIID